jgi:hypothetical protein
MIAIILGVFTGLMFLGGWTIYKNLRDLIRNNQFAIEYRNTFVEFVNIFNTTFERHWSTGTLDNEKYIWLTKNVYRIQKILGGMGKMDYTSKYRTYRVQNYEIIVNTLPMFRDGNIHDFDINAVDDCLIRYVGYMEEQINQGKKEIVNPVIWFRQGVQEVLSLPLYFLKWFGILSLPMVIKVTSNIFYKIFAGIVSIITFVATLVTIIQGKDETINFIHSLFPNLTF